MTRVAAAEALERIGDRFRREARPLVADEQRDETVAGAGRECHGARTMRAELDYALHYAETEPELRRALSIACQETDRLGWRM